MDKIDAILTDKEYLKCIEKINELEKERRFCRHSLRHALDVARIAYILSMEEKLDIDKEVIYGMALLHDVGRSVVETEGRTHHESGAYIAEGILIRAGFSRQDTEDICIAINGHKNMKEDGRKLDYILYRADKLSRNCFMCKVKNECYWEKSKKNETIRW